MPSRLSSLLVRDGLVGVKRMEKAFQRQVIYGGSLDTILLEMSLLPEDRLTQYLALASGLPPARRDEGAHVAAEALALVTSEIAAQFRAIPLSLDPAGRTKSSAMFSGDEALRVLVCSPLEITELEDLADLLDRPLQPLITPEYRWHLAYARAYELDAPARFTTLARTLEVESAPAPVGRPKSVIVDIPAAAQVDPDATAPLIAPPRPPPFGMRNDPTEKIDFKPPSLRNEPTDKINFEPPPQPPDRGKTLMGIRAPDAVGVGIPPRAPAPITVSPQLVPAPQTPRPTPMPTPPPPPDTAVTPSSGIPRPVGARASTGAVPRAGMARTAIEAIATAGRDSPLAVVRARELLATAEDRDTVFLTLLRAARARARYAGLLTVQGGAAIGRLALAESGIDTNAINSVLIPLDAMSPFRAVTQNQRPHIGSLASGEPAIDEMVLRLGGSMPPSALVLPIVLRDRVVALVVAHRVHSDLKLVDVTELLPLASGAADALGRLIVKHKSAGYRAPESAAPRVEIADDRVDTKKIMRKDAEWRSPAPAERPSVPEMPAGPELSEPMQPPRLITQVLDAIEAAQEGASDEAIADAVERAQETLGELAKRFPGKLRVDRFAVSGRPLRAGQYGGLLELLVRLGSAAGELIIDRMSSPQRDIRFYATVCAAELRPRNAVFALVERLFDQDYGVRSMAVEALSGYPVADMQHALPRARRALHSSDPETVAAATAALVALGDTDSIDDLIGAVERGDRAAEHARKALIALTAQDFGLSERKWRKWFDGARRRHRIEWLIEGLAHKEDTIREAAINDLRRLTGEYFGYHHDLPRKERDAAAERWSSWWRETGMRRFVHREDERHRPTGILPIRKD